MRLVREQSKSMDRFADPEAESMEDFLDRKRAFVASGGADEEEEDDEDDGERDTEPSHDREAMLAQLPERERLIVELMRRGERPSAIARYVGITTTTLSWRVKRLTWRLGVLSDLPSWSAADVASKAEAEGIRRGAAAAIAVWWYTSRQVVAARLLGIDQSLVSRAIYGAIATLRRTARASSLLSALETLLDARNVRSEPIGGWQLPPGVTVIRRGPKEGPSKNSDPVAAKTESKRGQADSSQLSFPFAQLACEPS